MSLSRALIALWLLLAAACSGEERSAPVGHDPAVRLLIDEGRYEQAGQLALDRYRSLSEQARDGEWAEAADLLLESRWRNWDIAADGGPIAARLLDIRQHEPDPRLLVQTLRVLGQTALVRDDLPDAAGYFQRALDTLGNGAGRDPAAHIDVTDDLAALSLRTGALDKGLASIDLQLRNWNRPPADDLRRARTLELQSALLQRLGRYAEARPPLEHALAFRARLQPEHPETAAATALMGDLFWFEGRLDEAATTYRKALDMAQQTLRPAHPEVARYTGRLANVTDRLGDVAGGTRLRENALRIAREGLGEHDHRLALYLGDLAISRYRSGDLRGARNLYEQALALREQRLGKNHTEVAAIVLNLASVLADLGDFGEAQRLYERAAAIWREQRGPDHPFVALALTGLARTLVKDGRAASAEPVLRRVLALRERSLGADHRDTAQTLVELARTVAVLRRTADALALSLRATSIMERHNAAEGGQDLVDTLSLRADLLAMSEQPQRAEPVYAQALEASLRAVGPEHPTSAGLRVNHAAVMASLGRQDEAFDESLEAEDAARRYARLTVRYLPEREAVIYSSSRTKGLDLALSVLMGSTAVRVKGTSRALDATIRQRTLALDELAARQRASATSYPGVEPLWDALVAARQRYANLVVKGVGTESVEVYQRLVDAARRERETAERRLAERSEAFRTERQEREIGLNEVESALPPDSALVSYVRFNRVTSPALASINPADATPWYVAFVISAGSPTPAWVDLGPARVIDEDVRLWRQAVAAANGRARPMGDRLRKSIWDPVSPHLRHANRVFVVPDGSIHLVTIAALPTSESRFVIDDEALLHYLSSERDLVSEPMPQGRGRGVLAIGGADFGASASPVQIASRTARARSSPADCLSLADMNFVQLPATVGEVDEIAGIWNATFGGRGEAADLLVREQAQERLFKERASGRRALHLATHGFFLDGGCREAGADSRGVGRLRPQKTAGDPVIESNPLLRVGLAFAGANRRQAAGEQADDGILTGEEVAGLDLRGVEWAVLSACETGLGEITPGEGVLGLQRAFKIAGVQTVIMSLWAVGDATTADWMRELYKGRLAGQLDTAAAIRQASRLVLARRRAASQSTEPLHWAAFVATGDWH